MSSTNEDFFQINTDILESFPKHRLPLNLYVFRDEIDVLEPFYSKGKRLTDAQIEELSKLCAEGLVFVSHKDQDVYKQHILRQLDLVLLDPHLNEGEIADLCMTSLYHRYLAFYEQPLPDIFANLYRDAMVVTEYLWNDRYRINSFVRRLFRKSHPARHAVNTMVIGLWLWMQQFQEYSRKDLDRMTIAFLLHDIGMSKTPQFIVAKAGRLKPDEMDKIRLHPQQSLKIIERCEVKYDEVTKACAEHHERLDGSGYPKRMWGSHISTVGKITALADSFSAMITERCYAQAKSPEEAGVELHKDARYDSSYSAPLATAFVKGGPFGSLIDLDARLDAEQPK